MGWKNREERTAYNKAYYKANREQILAYEKAKRKANPEISRTRDKLKHIKRREKVRLQRKAYYKANREKFIASAKVNYEANLEQIKVQRKSYRMINRKDISARLKARYQSNYRLRIVQALRARIKDFIHGKSRSKSSIELLGCDIDWLVAWLEIQFQPGMAWENYGPAWHIDHIRPCASFPMLSDDLRQQKSCFHWTNLQPLFAMDNYKKSARWENS